jgi:hypothetical protein
LKGKGPRYGQLELVREILGYLVEHPDAKDVPEGILKWWLPKGRAEWGKEDVQKALESLTSRGWLIERGAAPSKKIYAINKDQLEEIRDFLKGNRSQRE